MPSNLAFDFRLRRYIKGNSEKVMLRASDERGLDWWGGAA
jgi:hypothetical protein